jgi:hypothetical protein
MGIAGHFRYNPRGFVCATLRRTDAQRRKHLLLQAKYRGSAKSFLLNGDTGNVF